jgi:phosphatidylglycerophosphate synthase
MIPLTPELVRPWFVVVLLAREFLVSGLRSFLESQGTAFGARWGGKIKMVLQSALIPVALADGAIAAGGAPSAGLRHFGQVLVYATLAATIASMFDYLVVARRAIAGKAAPR